MKPAIGLNCDVTEPREPGREKLEIWRSYPAAVELAGGVPVLLPPAENAELVEAQLGLVDGLVLTGGIDYDPGLYGAKKHPKTELLHPARQRYDLELAGAAVRRKIPVLAICGGLQIMNIACGGDLIQEVAEVVGSETHEGAAAGVAHEVDVEPDSRLAKIMGAGRLGVNSTHHQAAGRIGRGLRVVARSADGVIEALESAEHPFLLCVQWHPERLTGEAKHLALFKALVEASTKRRH